MDQLVPELGLRKYVEKEQRSIIITVEKYGPRLQGEEKRNCFLIFLLIHSQIAFRNQACVSVRSSGRFSFAVRSGTTCANCPG